MHHTQSFALLTKRVLNTALKIAVSICIQKNINDMKSVNNAAENWICIGRVNTQVAMCYFSLHSNTQSISIIFLFKSIRKSIREKSCLKRLITWDQTVLISYLTWGLPTQISSMMTENSSE